MRKQDENTAVEGWPSSILVVDDDPNLLKFMGDFLRILGITPILAQNGQEAIDILKGNAFPLVFTDMHMPQINGMQLIAHIKEHYPGTDIVAMTAYTQDYGLIDVIRAGATDYMSKPFPLDELKAKITRVTRDRSILHFLQRELARQRYSEHDLNQEKHSLLSQVQQQKEELAEANAALRILLRQRDMEKNELATTLITRFQGEILPYLEKLKQTSLQDKQRYYLDVLIMNLDNTLFPPTESRPSGYRPFTEMESKIVNLLKQRKTSKEIAQLLQVSPGTIRTHRENIRKKLQITNTKKSLYKTIISLP